MTENTPPEEFKPGWRLRYVLYVMALINLAAALDATSISVALPVISRDLRGTAIEAFWSGTSFLVTSTVFQPIICSVSDIFGRKPAILLALLCFSIGAIIAAVSHNFAVMLTGRSIQGVGAGGVIAMTEVVLTDLIPLRERGKYFGIISAAWAIGSVCGPLIGGAFAQSASWRWIFWINLPFAAIGIALVPIFLQLHFERVPLRHQLSQIDHIGIFIFISSLTSFLIPLTWGGVMYAWGSWHTLVPLLLGIAGLAAFIVYEIYMAQHPMIPAAIFANTSSSINYLGAFIHGVVLWSMLYYLPLYYEGVQGYSLIISGVAMLPETLTVAPASLVVAVVVAIRGQYRWALWSGWILTTAGTGLLYILDVDTTTVEWIFLNIVPGLGTGLLFPALALATQASAPIEILSMSVTMNSFFRNLGQAVGVAIGGVVFQNRIKAYLQHDPDLAGVADQYAQDASALVQVIKTLPSGAQTMAIKAAYAKSLADLWAVMCGAAAIGLTTSIFVKKYTMDQELVSRQGFKHNASDDMEEKAAQTDGDRELGKVGM